MTGTKFFNRKPRQINTTFCGRRFKSMLFTASVSVCAEIFNILIDKIVAAQFLGEKALASITFFTPLYSIVLFVSAIVMVGTLVCYTFEIGKMNKHRADKFFGQGLILSIGSGLILMGIFAIIKGIVLHHSSLSPEIFSYIDDFYTWFLWFALLIPVNNMLQEMVYIDGDTRTCNISYAALLFGNIILSIIFCQSMGIEGIALGTLISVLLSIGVLCTHFFKKDNTLRFVWHLKWRDIRAVIRFSLAESSEFLLFALFSSVANVYFIRSFGFGELPVLSMVYEIIELGVFFNGIWMAAEPLVNTYRGEENDKGIIRTMQFVKEAALKESVFVSVLLFALAPFVISVFHIHSEELVDTATFAVRACAIGFLPMSIVKIFANYHVHEKPLLSVIFILLLVFITPIACTVSADTLFGGKAFWAGFSIAPFIAAAIGCAIQILIYGKERFPLLLEHTKELPDWHIIDTKLSPDTLVDFRNQMEEIMKERDIDAKTRVNVMLLIEELGMIIYKENQGNNVFVELSLVLRPDHLLLFCKDDGKIINLTDMEQSITDLRIYLVNMFMTVHREKQYLLTTNYNRYVFKFERKPV